jgi:signal transduction histidine kinase
VPTTLDGTVADVPSVLEVVLRGALLALRSRAGALLFLNTDERLESVAVIGLAEAEVVSLVDLVEQAIVEQADWGHEPFVALVHSKREDESLRGWRMMAHGLPDPTEPAGVIVALRGYADPTFDGRDEALLQNAALQVQAVCRGARPAADPLAESSRLHDLQNTFVSIVSHELQTPVAIIKGYAGTLRRPDATWSPAVVQRVAGTIEAECDRLPRLITDLLDLARIQAGRVAMAFHPVDLADLVAEVVHQARTRAPSRDIELEDLSELPVIRGDHDKLRMALTNLVDNAIKYSPGGGPVAVGGAVRDGQVLLRVRDQGIGIPTEERDRIFERFHRVDTSLRRETPGVGMGLYMCLVIVWAHTGRVWVESEGLGRGSTFYIGLPLVKP